MSPRHLVLIAGAAVTLGGLLYLFLEVRSAPASGVSGDGDATAATSPAAKKRTSDPAESARTELVGSADRRDEPKQAADAIASSMKGTISAEPGPEASDGTNPELEHGDAMDEANKHYDRGDYEAAMKQAMRVLEKDTTNVRMLRVVVSSACLMGDSDTATKYNSSLPANDQRDMSRRCSKFGITLAGGAAETPKREVGGNSEVTNPKVPARLNPLVKNQ